MGYSLFSCNLIAYSIYNNTAAALEHESPKPAMQSQWADSIVPSLFAIIHADGGVSEILCE